MKLVVLISCMHQKDASIIQTTNVQTDVVVINQCDSNSIQEFDFVNNKGEMCHAKFISTTERGLSRSRNMALDNSWGDVCLICDDDERLVDNYEELILSCYEGCDSSILVAAFAFSREGKTYPATTKRMGIRDICKTSSVEITFNRKLLQAKGITFDVLMGSGSGNGGGEDTKFLMDCWRSKSKMFFFPIVIGELHSSESLWFKGWNEKCLVDTGWTGRREFGTFLGYVYILATLCRHRHGYRQFNISMPKAFRLLNKGFFQKRI